VFEETIRWIAPIGMYSRQTTQDTVLAGTHLPAGAKLGICVLSANRDEAVWEHADRFDIHREAKPHLAFSKGVHVCLGNWAARAEIAEVALPLLFNSLEGLRIDETRDTAIGGWVFRGMLKPSGHLGLGRRRSELWPFSDQE
jgi:cytochrome P450